MKLILFVVVIPFLTISFCGCADDSPTIVQENSEYSYEDVMEKMAAEEAASLADKEREE